MTSPAAQSIPERSASAPAAEVPRFFESGDRPLYGVAYLPARPRAGAAVVVHCHSYGVEQLTSYRSEVITARASAALGFPTQRYHSRGHGDSGGDFADVTLETMVEDALAAAEHARAHMAAKRLVFLGVRFGALVAARAAAQCDDLAGVALWEPVRRGEDFFRGMLRAKMLSQIAAGRRPDANVDEMMTIVARHGRIDVHGYYLHAPMLESAREATLEEPLRRLSAPVLLVQIQARPALSRAHQALAAALAAGGAPVTTAVVTEEPGWNFVSNPAWRSADLVRTTTGWLDALA